MTSRPPFGFSVLRRALVRAHAHVLFGTVVWIGGTCFAADEGIVFEPITITSSAGETWIGSSSTVSLLERRTLERYQFADVAAAVDSVAGVAVQRMYLKQQLLTARGLLQDNYANKNLVLIDGIPLWHAASGENNLQRVALADVRRIEVLRGPASVLYGSQAYTGAVNLVLRDAVAGERSGDLVGGVGGDGAWQTGANLRLGLAGGWRVVASVQKVRGSRQSVPFLDESGARREVDDYIDASSLTFKTSWKGHALLLNAYDHTEGFLGTTPLFAQGAGGRHEVEGRAIAYKGTQKFTERLAFDALAFYDWNERDYDRTVALEQRTRIGGHRSGGSARLNWRPHDAWQLVAGADYEHRFAKEMLTYAPSGSSDGLPGLSVWERSVFGQAEWHAGAERVLAGTRYTENALAGASLTSRITGVHRLNADQSLKLIAAQSYRSPSLVEVYSLTTAIRGNPMLRPETSDSLEFAYLVKREGWQLQALGYYATYADKIYRVPDPTLPSRNTYANGKRFDAWGAEVELSYQRPSGTGFFLNADALAGSDNDAEPDASNPGRLTYNFRWVPSWNASGGAAWVHGPWTLAFVLRYTPAVDGPKGPVSGYCIADPSVSYRQTVGSVHVRHTLAGGNVFGADIAYPEFSRRRINEVPVGSSANAWYRVAVSF